MQASPIFLFFGFCYVYLYWSGPWCKCQICEQKLMLVHIVKCPMQIICSQRAPQVTTTEKSLQDECISVMVQVHLLHHNMFCSKTLTWKNHSKCLFHKIVREYCNLIHLNSQATTAKWNCCIAMLSLLILCKDQNMLKIELLCKLQLVSCNLWEMLAAVLLKMYI